MKAKNLLKCLSLSFLLLFVSNAFAQQKVSGTALDESGGGIPGVSVSVKGSTQGTITDGDGAFTLSITASNPILVFSSIGYTTKEISLDNQTIVNVTLVEDSRSLEEVIVTGYTITNKKESTAAASIVKAKDLQQIPSGNVEQQLQGRVAGLTVITNGQPGTASIIRVRGFGAFGGNEPLYVVDGIPVGSIDYVSPDDIASTTVLKDAAAASIYGARAANGVIVITTKQGTKGKRGVQVSYDGFVGFTDPNVNGTPDMLSPQEQADYTHIAYRNNAAANGTAPQYTHPQFGSQAQATLPDWLHANGQNGVRGAIDRAAIDAAYASDPENVFLFAPNRAGTDWYDAITRTGLLMRHGLGFSGGSETSRFYMGINLQDQAGILINNDFKRYTFRMNSEFDLGKHVRFGENLQATYRTVRGQGGGNGGAGVADDENAILQAYRMPSIIPVYDEYGNFASTRASGFNNPRNPVRDRENQRNDRNFSLALTGNVYMEVEPIKDLVFRSSIGGNIFNNTYRFYGYRYLGDSEPQASNSFGEGSGYGLGWTLTNTATYKFNVGKNGFRILAGQEALNTGAGRFINGSGINPFSMDTDFVTLRAVQSPFVESNLYNGVNFYSLFGKLDYNYNEKYYVTGVVRRDGSSRFGSNERYGIFPAFSAAWRITSEDFMKEIPAISDLKLRVGYGEMGNSNNVSPDNQYSLFGANLGNSFYPIAGQNSGANEGYYRTRIGNPDARWETSVSSNIGIDATLLNGRFELALDVWRKDTRDLLFGAPVPAVVGASAAAPLINIGSMRNQGIDIQLINRGKISEEVSYDVTWNNTFLQNEITALNPGVDFIGGPGYRGISPIRNQVGQSLSSFFGYNVLGYFGSQAEVDNSPAQDGAGVGRFKYEDVNGDGVITPDDRTFIGSPVAPYSGGLNFGLQYKNWDFNVYTAYSVGNEIFNMSKWFTDFFGTFEGAGKGERAKQSWTPELGNDALAPIWESVSNISTSGAENSWYVEDGSYLRVQNVSLGYNLSSEIASKLGLKRARIAASANNILTLTNYSGLDPSVGGDADSRFGVDVGNYPVTPSYNVVLNLGF
jgi:TonB-linked SusC/RagA family outer membrane protein